MHDLIEDVRYTLRLLWKRRGFAAVALIALALGSGATTAIFSVVNAVVLKPLPYPRSDRIVRIIESTRLARGPGSFSQDHFRAWRESNDVFTHMAAYNNQTMTLSGIDEPVQLSGMSVSPELFPLLGVSALKGRGLEPADETPGNERVVVLSFGAFRKYFGSDATVVGRTLTLEGSSYTVVGVMPPAFEFPDKGTEFWTPLLLGAPVAPRPGMRTVRLMPVIARLKDSVSIEQAQAEGQAVVKRLREQDLDPEALESKLGLQSLLDQMVGPVRPAILTLMVAVGFVLLIACANVANLLLARAAEREKEIALRATLGAPRLRLVRQTLTESLVLSFMGGMLGLAVAFAAVRLLPRIAPESVPRLDEASVDLAALAFTLGVSLVTGVLFGMAPALESFRVDLIHSLKDAGGRIRKPSRVLRHGGLRSVLVIAEIALALVLLIGAGLFIRSFVARVSVSPGYNPENVLVMEMQLPNYRYAGTKARTTFYDQVLERVGNLPGVEAAGVVNLLPLSRGNIILGFSIEGHAPPASEEQVPRTSFRMASPGFLKAMSIRLVRGRDFTTSDNESAPPVVLVNEALVQQYFKDEDPLGKRIQFGEIIGIVGNVKNDSVETEARPELYAAYAQAPSFMGMMLGRMSLVVKAKEDPLELLPPIHAQMAAVDPELPRFTATTMEKRFSDSVAQPRFYALALAVFAAVALALATIGIYGVVSYSVQQRTRETGVRMALGADRSDILRLVIRQGSVLIACGLALGVVAALLLTRLLTGLLYAVSAVDPAIFAGIAVLLGAVALLACYVPARRAAALNPIVALRYE